jgi:hypothetical protein
LFYVISVSPWALFILPLLNLISLIILAIREGGKRNHMEIFGG